MRRRLTLVILAVVAAALLIAGLGTLVLARSGARTAAESSLRTQADSTADLVGLGPAGLDVANPDLAMVRSLVCQQANAGGPPVRGGGASSLQELRDLLCDSDAPTSAAGIADLVCDEALPRLRDALPDDTRAAHDTFCADPTDANLTGVRDSLCDAPITGRPSRSRTALDRYARLICNQAQRDAQRDQLSSTLSQESIDLIVLAADDTIVDGSLPGGLDAAALQPDRLRAGETVSGEAGDTIFAAAPVTTGDGEISVIVIRRDADPLRESARWFLLSAGLTLLIGALAAAWLSRRLTDPLRNATEVTTRIANGDLTSRLAEASPGTHHDELDDLAHSINAMAAALERSKGLERQFLLSVSHDLRTPLTSIRGYAEALADDAVPDPQRAAEVILAESRRLERLVKDLLDLARLDARQFTLTTQDLDLVPVIGDSVDGFRREVEAAGLALVLDVPAGPVGAHADPDRLQQVVANLIENALKYARTSVTVGVVHADEPAGPSIVVGDDGPGIAAEDLPHVFERLYRSSAVPIPEESGSGLGLAIVHELVEAMGGSVHATSVEGAGTRIVVTLRGPLQVPAPGV